MSSSTSTDASFKHHVQNYWPSIAPYIAPPIAAAGAIVPAFRDLSAKSDLQKGLSVASMTLKEHIQGGLKIAPVTGAVVGSQMIIQSMVLRALKENPDKPSLSAVVASSAAVGVVSSPLLAVFNGLTMKMGVMEAYRKLTTRQRVAITIQETFFVGGLSIGDKLAEVMKQQFGDHKVIDYVAAFFSGATGSLFGHPFNTALTRWQNDMTMEGFNMAGVKQSMWGALHKARAIGCFSVVYKLGKEILMPKKETSEK